MKRFLSTHTDTIQHWLTHRHLPIMLACLGIALTLPALGIGLLADDFFHRAVFLEQWSPQAAEDASLFGMFSFFDGTPEQIQALKEAGVFPWWTTEEFSARIVFWRPLTEITHWLDYQLWADTPWLMHLHSLLWFGAAIWVMAHLYRRIIGFVWVAGLAGLLFTISINHFAAAGVLCQRNTLIAAFFGGLAFLAHVRWQQEGWRPGAVLGPVCYLAALLAKEAALAIGAYLFAYTLFLNRERVRRRAAAFLPYALISIGWYFVYHYLGFGARGIPFIYVDPGSDPLLFVKTLVVRIPVLLLAQFAGPPADLWKMGEMVFPENMPLLWYVVLAVLALIGLILFPLFRRDAVVRFWAIGLLLALVPACIAFPSSRLLCFSTIGAMGIIARFLVSWVEQPAWFPDCRLWKRSACVLCTLFVSVHLILSPLALPVIYTGLGVANRFVHHLVSDMPYSEDASSKTVVLVNPPIEPIIWSALALIRTAYGYPTPERTWALASGRLPLTIRRINERTVDIENEQGLLQTSFGHFLRGPAHPMYVGQQIVLSNISVKVLALTDNWQPSRARFTFAMPLDDPSLLWLQWEEGKGLVPYIPPAVGVSEMLLPVRLHMMQYVLRITQEFVCRTFRFDARAA